MLRPAGKGEEVGHNHGHSHNHFHDRPGTRSAARHKSRLTAALVLLTLFLGVEVAVGLLANSLALLADAGHMLTDVVGIGMALAAIQLADRAGRRRHQTFGLYRLEILAALANAVLLFGVAIYVLIEAVRRLQEPAEVPGGPVLIVAAGGLVVNLVAFALLREGSRENLNLEGAYLEVLADTLASVGVMVSAAILLVTGWTWVDAVMGIGIGLFIVPRTWRLARQALRILVQAAPPDTDLDALQDDLTAITGVVDVHDLHVWTLTSDMEVASAHVMVSDGTDPHGVLDQARVLLRDNYSIGHATLQVEPASHEGCDELSW